MNIKDTRVRHGSHTMFYTIGLSYRFRDIGTWVVRFCGRTGTGTEGHYFTIKHDTNF